jgi:coenzyme F420-reducing hydrogenase alpha subunit
MHQISEMSGFSIDEVTKIEGAVGLDVEIEHGKVKRVEFKISEFKRFYTHGMVGKPVQAIPQLLSRICGTCSTAHLLASIEAVEDALGVVPSKQTMILRTLAYHGLIIRDHALHLYLFSMPDIFGRDSLLEFHDDVPIEHQMLHDAFAVKGAGNHLAILVAGRSVHAPYPMPGGFAHFPGKDDIQKMIHELEDIRPAVLRLIKIFLECPFSLIRETNYAAVVHDPFSYLEGNICDSKGSCIKQNQYRNHLERVVIPYSQGSGYTFHGEVYRTGALARLNLNQKALHEKTRADAKEALAVFPSHDIYRNNLAQAIGILHSVDESLDLLRNTTFVPEPIEKLPIRAAVGVGVVEAPRGMLYHKLEIDEKGIVTGGEVVVPTGQNQIAIEQDLAKFIGENLHMTKEEISSECEKIIRAYDPCMSCASHFLKVNWKEE